MKQDTEALLNYEDAHALPILRGVRPGHPAH
jgi:hypothetical protein